MIRACGVALVLALGARLGAAQSPWLVGGRVVLVEQRVDAGFGSERFSGFGLGVEVARALGSRFTVQLRGQGAALQAAALGDLDRRLGEVGAETRVAVAPWMGFYGGLTFRAVANDAGRQHWTLARIGADMRPAFTGGRLRALGRVGVIPVASVSGLESASFAFDGAVGLEYAHDRVLVGFVYGLERFTFPPGGGVRRAEQVSMLTVRGAWTVR